jgi:hypothetical protein
MMSEFRPAIDVATMPATRPARTRAFFRAFGQRRDAALLHRGLEVQQLQGGDELVAALEIDALDQSEGKARDPLLEIGRVDAERGVVAKPLDQHRAVSTVELAGHLARPGHEERVLAIGQPRHGSLARETEAKSIHQRRPALGTAPQVERGRRRSQRGLPPLQAFEHLDERRRALDPIGRGLLQQLLDDRPQASIHVGHDGDLRLAMLLEHPERGRARERRVTHGELEQDAPEPIEIRPRVDRQRVQRLRRHIVGGSEHRQGTPIDSRERRSPRHPEVRDLGHLTGRDQDVGGLEVAVDDPGVVRSRQPPRHPEGERHEAFERERSVGRDHVLQRGSFDQLHQQNVASFDVDTAVHPHDVLVLDRPHDLGLAGKSGRGVGLGGARRVQNLAGKGGPIVVLEAIDGRHRPSPELATDSQPLHARRITWSMGAYSRSPPCCYRHGQVSVVLGCALAVLAAADDPVAAYDAQRVVVDTVFVTDAAGGREVVPKRPTFRTGDGRALTGPAFYAYVDRPDLVDAFRRRRTRKRVLIGVGLGLVAGGTGLIFGSIAAKGRTNSALLGSGVGLVAAGLVPFGIGSFASPHPVEGQALLDLARDKNTRLRQDLGLPFELNFAPTAGRSGGGARISGRF